jgi:UDP-N-acetyl-D-glucosamine dehydrogenase
MASAPLTPALLEACDAAIVITDHAAVDYELVARHAPLVVDTRGVYPRGRANVVKA